MISLRQLSSLASLLSACSTFTRDRTSPWTWVPLAVEMFSWSSTNSTSPISTMVSMFSWSARRSRRAALSSQSVVRIRWVGSEAVSKYKQDQWEISSQGMGTHRSGMSPMSWQHDPSQCPGNTDLSHVLAIRTLPNVLATRTFPMTWQHGPFPMSWQHRPFLCPGNTDLSPVMATRTFPLSWQHGPFPVRFYLSFCWRGLRGCQTCALHSAQLAVRELMSMCII